MAAFPRPRIALLTQVTIYVPKMFHCLASPGKCLLLLCKAKPAWIKRSIHYVTCSITIRGSYSKKFLPTSNVTFDTKGANFENDIASEKWLWNQYAFIKIINLGVILLEKECSTHKCTHWLDLVPEFFDISDRKCCILSGPPCIYKHEYTCLIVLCLWTVGRNYQYTLFIFPLMIWIHNISITLFSYIFNDETIEILCKMFQHNSSYLHQEKIPVYTYFSP